MELNFYINELYKIWIRINCKYFRKKRYILYFMLLRTIKIFDMKNEYEYIVSNLLRLKDIPYSTK